MKIHEYQAKALFREFGLPTLRGEIATTPDEAVAAAKKLGDKGSWVVKAQIHAGGRGKGGGIRLSRTLEDVKSNAAAILSKPLVTPQTGAQGKQVNTLLIEEGCDIGRELYCAAVLDRATSSIAVMASREGGVEIEEVAAKHPEKIIRVHVSPSIGVSGFEGRTLAFGLGLDPPLHKSFSQMIGGMVRLFLAKDCSLVEVNPLVVTKQGTLVALDAKVNFDDSGLFRHADVQKLADPEEEDPIDLEAAKWNLNYIHLDGNIGCMVNGAGLAMATMDIIKQAGGEPANFLDVGGGASTEMIRQAFKLLVSDKKVRAILVNIFGGIMKCDVLAHGIVEAAQEMSLRIPLVVRLEGTNVEEGRRILRESKLNLQSAKDMQDAARLAVTSVGGVR
ncbi:MAG TPA: ADP-forming succinate--CoA ligase subunit beta [Bdellovibrionota bacterium]|nr:ADP-forming succinate--CoA ligase subunit beta [Bdellovibrionota bacterium]